MFGTGLLVLMLVLLVLSSYHYYENRAQVLKRVDHDLLAGALAMSYSVGDAFHVEADPTQHPLPADYPQQITTLTELDSELQLDFLFSVVKRNGKLYFTLSSLKDQQLAAGDYHHYFAKPYAAVPADFFSHPCDKAYFFEAQDLLGSYRAVLLPRVSVSGQHYYAGAAIDVAVISTALAGTFQRALVQCVLLLLLAFPITGMFIWPLQCQLYTDELTSLANRERLKKDITACRMPQLMLVDIDAFKDINSYYGVHVGDQVLIKLADALRVLVPRESKIYRLGGDEFALLSESSPNGISVDYVVSRINELRFEIEETEFRISITAGVAQGKEQLMEHADLALKEAKRLLKPYKFYSAYLHTVLSSRANLLWTYRLKESIENNHLTAYFQPIHDNKLNVISHYEALIRIVSDDGTVAAPGFFMDAARKSRVYNQLTVFMLDAALEFVQRNGCRCTVNLLIDDILVEESRQNIIDRIRKAPGREKLIFEIVESEGIDNYDVIKMFIDQVRIYGIAVAIDDFGTGYSNFDHISQLDIDYIKIDGGLIEQLNSSARARTIVESIIHFAKELDIKIIAEYVSDAALQRSVVELGVDYSQGYYWGKPQPSTVS
ncbi:MAG: bifunctional diguanylate cyclase/phosphodiesterase [Desulfuromonas sp.]|nr:bifunctional diguanylate cyclase/phosphodiesterase [Desulfuromonas sp.]